MAVIKQKKNTTRKYYEIDGCQYRSKTLYDYHVELSRDKNVKSFTLPTIQTEQKLKVKRFGAFKVIINDILFDSIMESRFYIYLMQLKDSKEIKKFERQVTFELQKKFRNKFTNKIVLPINYIADFVVTDKDNNVFVIDIKGLETPDFKIKKKLFMYKYPDVRFMCIQWRATTKEWLDLEDIKKMRRLKKKNLIKSKKGK